MNRPSPISSFPSAPLGTSRLVGITLVLLLCVLAWDASGLDLAAAQVFGTPAGFPWRWSKQLSFWLHDVPRIGSWFVLAACFASIRWPVGVLRQLDRVERTQLALSALAAVLAVSLMKSHSKTSCPWDLQVFGGIARYVSHWAIGVADGGPGGCFPAGHASAAFAWFGGYFVFRRSSPAVARRWLVVVLVMGSVFGIVQQMRGAHYMSHTLWTAWICWTVTFAIDAAVRFARRPAVRIAAKEAA
ncbi:membrane-associated PAP2 superfamily phosphatase [Variovorax sp. GrIS 2.14]|uniref:phosphatase PAP2 family protein n=1 Tax=Variovorax sp. GrIS 2.14 TaxID=3071709 RepID=UPI0038F66BE3